MLHRPRVNGELLGAACRCPVDTGLGHAERLAALDMSEPWSDRQWAITFGPDRGYDVADFVEADLWNWDYLDFVKPAYLQIGHEGWAEFAFGCSRRAAGSNIPVFFRWSGFDEGDKVSGDGSAELQDDGTIEIELSFRQRRRRYPNRPPRMTSSTACYGYRKNCRHSQSRSKQKPANA